MNRPHVPGPSQVGEVLETAVADLAARHGALLHHPIAMLEVVTALISAAETLRDDLTAEARTKGHTWQEIADARGVSRKHARTHHDRKEPRTA